MKKVDFVKLIVVGIVASFCISGQKPFQDNKEIAMSKCTKTTSDTDGDSNGKQNPSPPDDEQMYKDATNKSAAQRVVEGCSNSSINGKRKSAAQRAMEG